MWIDRTTKRVLERGGPAKAARAFNVPQEELKDVLAPKAGSNQHAIFYYGDPPALPPEKKYWKVPAWDAADTTSEWVDLGTAEEPKWRWMGGRADSVITEMTQAEKDAVDDAEKATRNAQRRAILDQATGIERALALVILDIANGDLPGSPPYTAKQLLDYIATKMAE